jgi:mannose-6-phosphate isomerase
VIEELLNVIQPYAWGSRTALATLRGERSSSAPEAELWMGAHPLAPSRLASSGESLLGAIARRPAQYLGAALDPQRGEKLPFLLKVLAAATPLSLQAHPSLEQATTGYATEEASGVPLDAPHRKYKDPNHKPELLCALTEFWALCGFRKVTSTLALLDELALPELTPYRNSLAESPDSRGIQRIFSMLMLAPPDQQRALAERTAAVCRARLGVTSRFAEEWGWAARIAELYPGDIGLLGALLLNLVRLEPGEAIYLPAGNLHAYLGGTGIELMASSDNVLRGGLTPKYIDVPELLRVLDFSPIQVEPLLPEPLGAERVYVTPIRDFRLSYFELENESLTLPISSAEIWLVTRGAFELTSSTTGERANLAPSRSAFVSADTGKLTLAGKGRIFRATVNQPA